MPALTNPRREKAAQNVAKGMNYTDAYVAAGYKRSPKAASQLFKLPEMQERLKEISAVRTRAVNANIEREVLTSAQVAEKLGITKEKIIQSLWWNAQRCLRGQPVIDPATGEQIPGRYTGRPDAAGANQALRLLGFECHNMFIEKLEIGGPGDFSRLSDAEFDAKLREEALAAGLDEQAVAGLLTFSPPDETKEE